MDEASVLERVRGGDADAFGELFDLHHDRVFRQAIRLTSSLHDAEDVTAVVFLEAWRRRDAMRVVNDSVIGWLLVMTNFVFRNYARASRRYRDGLQQLPPRPRMRPTTRTPWTTGSTATPAGPRCARRSPRSRDATRTS